MDHPLNQSITGLDLPAGLRARPVSSRGFPVPWFVTVRDAAGEFDFRIVDPARVAEAHNKRLCWICGGKLGRWLAFAVGPMCCVNRISAEPPAHRDCAEYAAKACPFLAHPRARRNEAGLPPEKHVPGVMIPRNPGVIAVWITDHYRIMRIDVVDQPVVGKGVLFQFGRPKSVTWWAEGRPATAAEVRASVASGMPALEAAAALDGSSAELPRLVRQAEPIFAAAGAAP